MDSASERLRSLNPYKDPELTNASAIILNSADVIDALVAALVQARGCDVDPATAKQIDAALTLARK